MKHLFKTILFASVTVLSFTTISCTKEDTTEEIETPKQLSIGAYISTTTNYSSLKAALTATNLMSIVNDENLKLTIFAPGNEAFTSFLTSNGFPNGLSDVDTEEEIATVKNILLNHVIVGSELKAKAVIDSAPGYIKNAAIGPKNVAGNNTNISTFYHIVSNKVTINGQASVTTADAYDATNGILHSVDKVIELPKISTFALADERLSILKDKLIDRNLVATVDGLNPATVFAPLNDAFNSLKAIPTGDALSNVLTYHVVSGANAEASDLPALGATTPATVQSQTIEITSTTSIKGNSNETASTFVLNDIQASNGIVHVINRVLLPSNK